MPPPYYGLHAWSFPLKGKWESSCDIAIPPEKRGRPMIASGDFTRTDLEWPTIALVDYASLGIPGDSGIRSVNQEMLDFPNYNVPFFNNAWIKQQGWMVWIRWRFYKGDLSIPQNEVKVPRGQKPDGGDVFYGPDGEFVDDKVHSFIFMSGCPPWTYTIDLPQEVTRFVCDMQYDGGPQEDHNITSYRGFGAFIINHQINADLPPWPYKTPSFQPAPAGTRTYRLPGKGRTRPSSLRRARRDLTHGRGARRITGQYVRAGRLVGVRDQILN